MYYAVRCARRPTDKTCLAPEAARPAAQSSCGGNHYTTTTTTTTSNTTNNNNINRNYY